MFWNSDQPKNPCEQLLNDLEKCMKDNNDDESKCSTIKSQFELICSKEKEKKDEEKKDEEKKD